MDIERFHIYAYRLPLNRPLVFGGTSHSQREGLLVRLTSGDCFGWGEIAPLPGFSTEDIAAATDAVQRLRFSLRGQSVPDNLEELSGGFDRWIGKQALPPSVRFGFECAVLTMIAGSRGLSLAGLLSDHPHGYAAVNGLITADDDQLSEELARIRDEQYRTVKIKVGSASIEQDIVRVRMVAAGLGGQVALRLDANRAWEFDDAIRFADGISGVPIVYVEEPLADPSRLPELSARTSLPIALDESMCSLDPETLTSFDGLAAVILKPTLLGGVERAMRFARRAIGLGLTPVVSSAVESTVGSAALVHLAAALTSESIPIGLDTLRWFDRQPVGFPLRIRDARLQIEDATAAMTSVELNQLREV